MNNARIALPTQTPVPTIAPATPVRFLPVTADVPALPADTSSSGSQGFFDSLRAVTPALIITGIAIGIASGIGSTVGSAIGAALTDGYHARFSKSRPKKR